MSASTYASILIRRDSGMEIDNDIKFYNVSLEPYDRAVVGDNVTNDPNVDTKHSISHIFKRAHSDANLGGTEPSEDTVKKGKVSRDDIQAGDERQRRVLCPFYQKDPEKHKHTVSCHHKGFEEMSRLKQHLVQVHSVSPSLLNFKSKTFKNLANIEAKWAQVYRILFQIKSEGDIPSPCKYLDPNNSKSQAHHQIDKDIVPIQQPTVTPAVEIATPFSIFQAIVDHNDNEPGFLAAIKGMLGNVPQTTKINNTATKEVYGIQTPPSSVESSPALSNLDTATNSDLESAFELPINSGVPNNNFADLPLFPAASVDSPSSSNSPVDFMWDTPDTTSTTAQTVNISDMKSPQTINNYESIKVCSGCLSNNIFKTTGSGAQIDVCGNCHSTDVLYGASSAPIGEVPEPLDTGRDLSIVPTLTAHSSPTLAPYEPVGVFMGADAVVSNATGILNEDLDFYWDERLSSEGGNRTVLTNEDKELYSDIDTLLAF